jgi:exonuclease SbcC
MQSHSGGIQIDAVFIDEGFGSLDGESLDSVMNVIAGLADGNRLVGIISHVDALKERIPNKILIERGKTGSSISNQA